jgi:hypothetical protein
MRLRRSVLEIVHECARRINSHFSMLRAAEIGDGRVSDLVGWGPARFAELWKK